MLKMKLNLQYFAGDTINGSSTASNCDCRIVWSSSVVEGTNTSKVTASIQVYKSGSSSTTCTFSGTLKIDGTSYSVSKYSSWAWGKWHTIGSKTKTVTHNADGTKSISISGSVKTPTSETTMSGTYKASGTAKLDDINRASKINEIEETGIDESITLSIEKYISTATDYLVISHASTIIRESAVANNGDVITFTEAEKTLITSLMTSPKINLAFTLTTINDGETIGESSVIAKISSMNTPIMYNIKKKANGHYQMSINGLIDENNDMPFQIYDDEGNLISLGGNNGASSYSELPDKPSINGVTLSGNKTSSQLGLQPAGNYATSSDIPTKTSQLTNDSGFITSIPNEYVTETELTNKGYITSYTETDPTVPSHVKGITSGDITNWNNKSDFSGNYNDLSNKPTIPTKTSQLTNDSGYITGIPSEYVTESELASKGYITNIPSEYITETELNNKGYLTSIPSDYKTKTENDKLYQPIGDYITSIPSEYVTDSELNAKGYLTSIPSEYVTETELNAKKYLTSYNETDPTVGSHIKAITTTNISNWNGKQDKLISGTSIKTINNQSLLGSGNITITAGDNGTSDYNALENIPSINGTTLVGNKTLDDLGIQAKGNYLTSVPSEYVTESELTSKGYITGYTESDPTVPSHVKSITSSDITKWNNKSDFSGSYNDLTNKPTIPTKTSQLTNDSGYLTSVPSEYVTETELSAKGYLTSVPSTYKTKTENDALYQPKGNYLTSVPSEYVTDSELTSKGYLTSVPDEYITETELTAKNYATTDTTDILVLNDENLFDATASLQETSDAQATSIETLESRIEYLQKVIESISTENSTGLITERVEGGWITYGID